jgi:hypothetical protein
MPAPLKSSPPANAAKGPLPFAHAFFTDVAPNRRKPDRGGHRRMRDHIKDLLEPIPELSDNPVWTLADVVGQERAGQIEATGAVRIHMTGDTGGGEFPVDKHTGQLHFGRLSPSVVDAQVAVARAMNADLDPSRPGESPAFFFHLGDVNYFNNTAVGYHEQFYVPYEEYGGKIIAIPGNHDGEVILGNQPSTCIEFMRNFCPPHPTIPPAANPIVREMSAQPGVYWWLQMPFLDLIGLYSNVAEGPGHIRGKIPGEHQYEWLKEALKKIVQSRQGGDRKALIVATHHPPITAKLFDPQDPGHSPSDEMGKDLDDAFNEAGVWPEAIVSAHVHNYQRFTRTVEMPKGGVRKVAYLICGAGGRSAQAVLGGHGQQKNGIRFERAQAGHGYLLVTARANEVQFDYHPVDPDPADRDQVVLPLQ